MKRFSKFSACIIMMMLLATQYSKGSHMMGGELTYRWISGNTYEVTLIKYRDCAGAPMNNFAPICLYSASGGINVGYTLLLTDSSQITPICSGQLTYCNGGLNNGFERYVYSETVTIPGNYPDWIFYEILCCRNGATTNLNNGSGYGMMLTATLDNFNVPFNNSPVFGNNPVLMLNQGITYHINNGAFDPDGDSLVIELAPAVDGLACASPAPIIIPYNAPFSYTYPMSSVPPLTVDPQSGDITVTPQNLEVDVIALKVSEYRNGVLIGSITRDIQIQVIAGSNQLPEISGINGTNTFITNVCAGSTLNFSMLSSDADASDSSIISSYVFSMPNSSFTIDTTLQNQSAVLTWTPDSTMISPNPYYLTVTVHDNYCQYYGEQTFTYIIYVNQCVSNDVWPGDANSDLYCNMYDVLPIGIAYGSTGPVRAGASLAWVAQPSTPWAQNLNSGINYKHIDTNGDGTVNDDDTLAISQNYGLYHPNRLLQPVQTAGVANLYLVANPDSTGPNGVIDVEIRLGTAAVPIDSIYGIAFRINFIPQLVDTDLTSFGFENSWFGTPGGDLITFSKPEIPAGYIDAAAVRNDFINASGDSTIAKLTVVVVDNISGKTTLSIWLSDVKALTYAEAPLIFNLFGDSIVVDPGATGITGNAPLQNSFYLYPNLLTGPQDVIKVFCTFSQDTNRSFELFDVMGRKVFSQALPQSQKQFIIKLPELPGGLYNCVVTSVNGSTCKKLVVVK